jgi:hypothetical protein
MDVPMHYMTEVNDPSTLGWPSSLPLELALAQQSVREICTAYGLTRQDYERLRRDHGFRRSVAEAAATLQEDGATFRLKAKAQSEELLKTSWGLIHAPLDQVSASVKATLIQMTIRCAGLDQSIEQKARAQATAQAASLTALTINLHLE